jgi:pimeloyl-ACP methyl ester carboxylesterase
MSLPLIGLIVFVILFLLSFPLQYQLWLKLFFYPPKRFRLIENINPGSFKIPFEPFEVNSADGTIIRGWFIKSKDNQSRKTILVCHGVTSSRYFHLPRSIYFYYLGYNLCLFDLRAHGHSEGNHVTFGFKEQEDMDAVVQYIRNRKDLGSQKICLVAHSMGAATGVLYAAKHPHIFDAIVLLSCYAQFEKDLEYWVPHIARLPKYPFVAVAKMLFRQGIGVADFKTIDPIEYIDLIHSPIFFVHGQKDVYTSPRSSEQLFAKANEPKQLWLIPKASHEDLYEVAGREWERRIAEFLKKNFTL